MPKLSEVAAEPRKVKLSEVRRLAAKDPIAQGADDYAAAGGTERFANDARQRQAESDASVNAIGPNIVAGVTEGVRSTGTGVLQLGAQAGAIPERLVGYGMNKMGMPTQDGFFETAVQALDDYSSTRKQAFANSPAGQSAWGIVPNYLTQAAAMYPLAAASVPAKGASAARIIGQGATGGLGMGLASEGTGEQKIDAAMVNTVLGGLVPAAVIAGGKVTGGVRDFVSKNVWQTDAQAEREAALLFEKHANDLPAALRNISRLNRSYVPDSVPTTAELSGDVGLLAAQNARKSVSDEMQNFINTRSKLNDQAREKYIRDTFEGADRTTYDALKGMRDGNAAADIMPLMDVRGVDVRPVARYIAGQIQTHPNRLYLADTLAPLTEKLLRQRVPQRTMDDVARWFVGDALKSSRASTLTGSEKAMLGMLERGGKLDAPMPSGRTVLDVLKASKNPEVQSIFRYYNALRSRTSKNVDDFANLYDSRKTLNDMIEARAGTDEAAAKLRVTNSTLIEIRNRLDEQILKVADGFQSQIRGRSRPDFAEYLGRFKATTKRMQQNVAGQELLARGAGKPLGQNTANLADDPDRLAQMAANNDQALAADVFTPEQRQSLNNLREDYIRQQSSRGIGSANIESEARGVGAFGQLQGTALYVANKALNAISRQHGKKAMMVFDEMLKNPDRAVQIMAKLPAQNRTSILRKYLPAFGLQASYGLMRAIQDESRRKPEYAELPTYTP